MEWHPAIRLNHAALKRFVVVLFQRTGLDRAQAQNAEGAGNADEAQGERSAGGQLPFFPQKDAGHPNETLAGKRKLSPASLILPRYLYRAILSLLRPAEAATRRLIIALACALPAPAIAATSSAPQTARPEKPVYVRAFIGMHGGVKVRFLWKYGQTFPAIVPIPPRAASVNVNFALLDPIAQSQPFQAIKPSTTPRDAPVDAFRLGLRLQALAAALDDMPRYAERFARWRARATARGVYAVRDANGMLRVKGRTWPLHPRPPGCRLRTYDPDARAHYRSREIDRIAIHCHALADFALRKPPDTS